jgi:hypothetical protein
MIIDTIAMIDGSSMNVASFVNVIPNQFATGYCVSVKASAHVQAMLYQRSVYFFRRVPIEIIEVVEQNNTAVLIVTKMRHAFPLLL